MTAEFFVGDGELHNTRFFMGAEICDQRSLDRLQMPDRRPGRKCLRGGDYGVRVDTIVTIEIGDGAGLPEMLDA